MTLPPDDRATEAAISSGVEAGDNEAVLRAVATSTALLPQAPPAEGEERPEGAVALPVIEQDGKQYIPVFTSEEALRAAGADPSTAVRIPLAQLAANWPDDDLWLAVNPANEQGLSLPPDLVRALPVFAAGDGPAGNGAVGAEGSGQGTDREGGS
jgi:type III secretion system (T3SS) SseB-like protein